MLIRETTDELFECVTQEQHGFVSGVLASAWTHTHLEARLVQVIGLHDTPWRRADRELLFNPESGLPHDFITYPMTEKVQLYRHGIDELEDVDPLAAYLVSLHYTTFSGTREYAPLTVPEEQRRERLERFVSDYGDLDRALQWIKFFDILSLYVCLTGPRARLGAIPGWLKGDAWQTSPDGVELALRWADDETLTLGHWPFRAENLALPVRLRVLEERVAGEAEMRRAWKKCEPSRRRVRLVPRA